MKSQRTFLTIMIRVMLITGISIPASAADNCFTFGLVPLGLGVEYERVRFCLWNARFYGQTPDRVLQGFRITTTYAIRW